ncbi:polarity establishment/cellular polarization [Scheffersomyces coipomensis]|uniref:polarity establishment/cellular polarization n=1 Tax=Scheffersomyces coipomensis TaxID=1788519 RepID=UPI00315D7552
MLFILIFQILCHLLIVRAQVYIGFPFDEQLPNVARINQTYSFTLANITYKSTNDATIQYSASNLPTWLSFDGSSRTFSGLPSADDVSQFQITLTGTDPSDNSVSSNNYSMIVSNDTGLHLSSDDVMFTQIAQYGQTNGADGLVVTQGQNINIKFAESVFQSYPNSNRPIIAYYGRSADRSSLPPWLEFNSDDLSFSGTVPYVVSDIAPSYEYSFAFIGSDYYGFAGATGIFNLIVGAHQLSTSLNETIKVNGTFGASFEIQIPVLSDVFLDGSPINQANISTVTATDLPSFIQFDNQKFTLSGTFPNSSTFDNFSIVVEDVFQNSVQLPFSFDSIDSLFTIQSFPNINATKGEFFQYQLLQSDFTDFNDTKISVDFNSSSNWLTFTQSNLTFTGQAPSDFDQLQVNINAQSDSDNDTKNFNIVGVSKQITTSSSSSSSSSSSATSTASSSSSSSSTATASTSSSPDHQSKSSKNHKALIIGLAAGIPAFVLAIAAIFLICCCVRRRRRNDKADNEKGNPPTSPELTGPGFGTTINKDDRDENAKQLASLNALKLNSYENDDARSTSSSLTQVDSNDSRYVDADEKPIKSWRAKDGSDNKNTAIRNSNASVSTVNTEQLFSVRLVDDGSYRNSNQSSLSRNFLSNNSLNGLLAREYSSGNIQRLDSDGNIVDNENSVANGNNRNSSPRKGLSRDPSNLDVLLEENTRDFSSNTIYHNAKNYQDQSDGDHPTRENTEGSISNLLHKFNDNSHSGSEHDMTQYNDDDANSSYLDDEFKATKASDGQFKWTTNNSRTNLISPSSDHFDLNNNDTPTTKVNTSPTMKNSNFSALSVNSNNSDNLLLHEDSAKQMSTATLKATISPTKAKLVDFTRKGSLRESAYEPDYKFQEEVGQIHYNDSD